MTPSAPRKTPRRARAPRSARKPRPERPLPPLPARAGQPLRPRVARRPLPRRARAPRLRSGRVPLPPPRLRGALPLRPRRVRVRQPLPRLRDVLLPPLPRRGRVRRLPPRPGRVPRPRVALPPRPRPPRVRARRPPLPGVPPRLRRGRAPLPLPRGVPLPPPPPGRGPRLRDVPARPPRRRAARLPRPRAVPPPRLRRARVPQPRRGLARPPPPLGACAFLCLDPGALGRLRLRRESCLLLGFGAGAFLCVDPGALGRLRLRREACLLLGFDSCAFLGLDPGALRCRFRLCVRTLLGFDSRLLGCGCGCQRRGPLRIIVRLLGCLRHGADTVLRLERVALRGGRRGQARALHGVPSGGELRLAPLALGRFHGGGVRLVGVGDDGQRRWGSGREFRMQAAQLASLDLPARGLRELGDECDLTRAVVRRGDRLDMLLELGGEAVGRLLPRAQDDERLHDLAAVEVGHADDGALGDRRMLEERALDLERADAIRRRDDHVVCAPDEPEVPVRVARRSIAREVPVVPEDRGGLVGRLPVAGEERRRTADEREVSLDAGRADLARRVDHGHVVARGRKAHGPRPDGDAGRVRDEKRVLGLAVAVVHREPQRILESRDDLGIERLADRDGVAEPGQMRELQLLELGEHPVLRRSLGEDRDTEPLQEGEPLLGIERSVVHHDLRPVRPRAEERVPDPLRPPRLRGAPDDVALVRVEPVRRLGPLRPRVRMRVHDAPRLPVRAGRVEDQGGLSGGRVLGRRDGHVPAQLVERLVQEEHRYRGADLVAHLLDLELERPVGQDEPRARVADAEREIPCAEELGARNRDQPALDRAEHRGLPGRDVPDREHDTIAPVEPRAHEMRPARRVARDLVERASIDDPLAVDEGHRGLERVGRDRLDHVAREVEAGRDVPPGRVRPGLRDSLVPGLPTQQRHQGRLATVGTSATWRGWHSTLCTLLPPLDAPATRRHRSLALETARVWSRSWRPWLPT